MRTMWAKKKLYGVYDTSQDMWARFGSHTKVTLTETPPASTLYESEDAAQRALDRRRERRAYLRVSAYDALIVKQLTVTW